MRQSSYFEMLKIIQAKSEFHFDQVRLLLGEYRRQVEQMATASGACP
jgi:hypothetical protein